MFGRLLLRLAFVLLVASTRPVLAQTADLVLINGNG